MLYFTGTLLLVLGTHVLVNDCKPLEGRVRESPPTFCCTPERCLPYHWKCDGEKDCQDGADEEHCDNSKGTTIVPSTIRPSPFFVRCSEDEFACEPTQCVPKSKVCDGVYDCANGGDEMECNSPSSTTSQPICRQNEFYCQSDDICVPILWHCDGIVACSQGEDEQDCLPTTILPTTVVDCSDPLNAYICNGITCPVDEMRCNSSNTCIPLSWQCDGYPDCDDGGDEEDCPPTCSGDQFMCTEDLSCIQATLICDGENDCPQGSDETDCDSSCTVDQMRCNSSSICIPLSWRCDGEPDCHDGEDEEDCPPTCSGDQFMCTEDLSCIQATLICDGDNDCPQGSDETDCSPVGCSGFFCSSTNTCVPGSWRCDGESDCPYGDDERACSFSTTTTGLPSTTTTMHIIQCTNDQYQCEPTQCISRSQLCDGRYDCANGADEVVSQCPTTEPPTTIPPPTIPTPTPATNSSCTDSKFDCGNGICLPLRWQCDGQEDCPLGNDEENCGRNNKICQMEQFDCGNGICIPSNWQCDGEPDCSSGSDEKGCS